MSEHFCIGIADNTLIFFTADNGCAPEANIPALLETAIANGRTTHGPKQENDVEVVIWKDAVADNP
ncbi:MAG: hypothetical protein ACNA8L_08475 [Luteolibacter sp.]